MFVAMSRFAVANGMTEAVKEAFRQRPGLVEEAPGFERLEVISPLDAPEEIWLITMWDRRESFEAWHRGHGHSAAHTAIPKGLKLDPARTLIRYFEHVTS